MTEEEKKELASPDQK